MEPKERKRKIRGGKFENFFRNVQNKQNNGVHKHCEKSTTCVQEVKTLVTEQVAGSIQRPMTANVPKKSKKRWGKKVRVKLIDENQVMRKEQIQRNDFAKALEDHQRAVPLAGL